MRFLLIVLFFCNCSLKEPKLKPEDTKFSEEITVKLFENITLDSAGVFLYTKDYKTRYLFIANTSIVNPISNVDEDSFFPTLFKCVIGVILDFNILRSNNNLVNCGSNSFSYLIKLRS